MYREDQERLILNILWINVVTTGLDPNKNGVIELDLLGEVLGKVTFIESIKCKIPSNLEYDKSTLEYLGVTENQLIDRMEYTEVISKFEDILSRYVNKFDKNSKFRLAGHNVKFSREFLTSIYANCNNQFLGSWIESPSNDIELMEAYKFLEWIAKVPITRGHSIKTIAEALGFKYDIPPIDGLSKLKLTRSIGVNLCNRIYNIGVN